MASLLEFYWTTAKRSALSELYGLSLGGQETYFLKPTNPVWSSLATKVWANMTQFWWRRVSMESGGCLWTNNP